MTTRKRFSRRSAVIGSAGTGVGLAMLGSPRTSFASSAQTSGTPESGAPMKPYLTLDSAQAAVEAALSKADEIGVPMNVMVLDESGTIKAFARQDGALLGSVTIATDKAMTAVSFGAPTHALAEGVGSDPVMLASFTNLPNTVLIPGGYPIMSHDVIIGAIGVSGGAAEQDQECAEAGLAAISE